MSNISEALRMVLFTLNGDEEERRPFQAPHAGQAMALTMLRALRSNSFATGHAGVVSSKQNLT